jgi:hypothetical protein
MMFVQRLLSILVFSNSCMCILKADCFLYFLIIKLGIGKEKALSITQAVQKYGNLSGFGK